MKQLYRKVFAAALHRYDLDGLGYMFAFVILQQQICSNSGLYGAGRALHGSPSYKGKSKFFRQIKLPMKVSKFNYLYLFVPLLDYRIYLYTFIQVKTKHISIY